MSRHYHVDVTTLGQCRDNVATLGKFLEPVLRHCCRCRDIKKEFSSFRKFLLVYPILFLQIQLMLVNISLSILRNINSSTNSNTQFFNSVNSTNIHCIVEIIT